MTNANGGILLNPVLAYLGGTLMAYQSLSNPMVYKSEHQQMLQLCSSPFRDSFEDELRAFDGGVDGFLPCVWDVEMSNFPQDNTVKIRLLNNLDQCLKSGKKQSWFMTVVTNSCVALLSGLKARSLLGELITPIDLSYTASVTLSLGCIHRADKFLK
uniref:Uncharacterized protein n=1 Tax=Oryza sativa subsp. japonica TaxID=39947 RepID=Q654D5_ORYSJ|nr:hypothetical protein [Oryza sativa Japonica Group]